MQEQEKKLFVRPIQEHEDDAVYQMFQDIPAEENYAQNKANGMTRQEFDDFCKQSVAYSKKEGLPEGRVPQTIYILFEKNTHTPVGFGKFRPFLNEDCSKRQVGHAGVMISPKHRNKGYAKEFLAFLKEQARALGMAYLELGVLEDNEYSRRSAERNGGQLQQNGTHEIDGKKAVMYKVPTIS